MAHTPEKIIARAETIARLLDARFRIPGTDLRFGLDTLLGLVPVVGDALTLAIGLMIPIYAMRLGAPKHVIGKMLGHLLVDYALSLLPIADIVLDTLYKANLKNADLLVRWAHSLDPANR